jgi:predicted dinucleotide-binding enzyme
VVKAFNTIGATQHHGQTRGVSMPICGNDGTARRTVAGLAEALSFESVVEIGPLAQARLLEPLAMF